MAGKISEYANAVATFADGDLVDVSKRLSTSPDVFQSQKLEFAQFQAFIQANASNILNTNGLTLGGNYSHNLNGNALTFTNGNINLDGKFAINATDEGFLFPRLTTAQKNAILTPDLNLVVFDTDLNNLQRWNGSAWVSMSAGFGKIGIANNSGEYDFYSTFADAIAGASSGDTIQLFTDIIETTDITVNCINGVNINFNGFTYTLNTSGGSNAFTLGTGVSMSMFNGRILRTGATASSTSKVAIRGSGVGTFKANSMIFENDFGTAGYFSSSLRKVIGGKFYGLTIGCYLSSAILENSYLNSESSYALELLSGGTARNCYAYSLSGYGVYNNNGKAYDCTGFSSGSIGFYMNNGFTYGCKGYSSANYGLVIAGSSGDVSDIFGYSSAGSGVNLARSANNIVGVSTSSYGVRYTSGSGNQVFSNVTASSTSASGLYIFKNAGTVEFSNINVITTWNNAAGHALTVFGTSNNIIISKGSLRVENSSANCLYSSGAKSLYFVGLAFTNSTTAVNANITNLQSNTPDAFGNILIG